MHSTSAVLLLCVFFVLGGRLASRLTRRPLGFRSLQPNYRLSHKDLLHLFGLSHDAPHEFVTRLAVPAPPRLSRPCIRLSSSLCSRLTVSTPPFPHFVTSYKRLFVCIVYW